MAGGDEGGQSLRWEDCVKRDAWKAGEEEDWTRDRVALKGLSDEAVKKLCSISPMTKGKTGRERKYYSPLPRSEFSSDTKSCRDTREHNSCFVTGDIRSGTARAMMLSVSVASLLRSKHPLLYTPQYIGKRDSDWTSFLFVLSRNK